MSPPDTPALDLPFSAPQTSRSCSAGSGPGRHGPSVAPERLETKARGRVHQPTVEQSRGLMKMFKR